MSIKQLASQTMWYGMSNILARFINVLVTPILTYLLADGARGLMDMGGFTLVYAWIAVANIVFTYGMETGYFRFVNKENTGARELFNTTASSLICTTIPLGALILMLKEPIHDFFALPISSDWVILVTLIIALDTIATIPFARLRQDGRPLKYAFVKVSSVVVYVLSIITFLYIIPVMLKDVSHPVLDFFRQQDRVTLIIGANLVQNIAVFLLLLTEWKGFSFRINLPLWKKILSYSLPMVIIGLAGMVNEVLDREFLKRFLPYSPDENLQRIGIYGANYKIAVFITLFIQAFRLGAEPFFFKQSSSDNAPVIYARVLKWFTITLCVAFLIASLNLNVIILAVSENYREGMHIIPVILLANVFLGMYYNLSMWYKITDNMRWGIIITVAGAAITVYFNYLLIPGFDIMGAAYATLICYFSMCVLAYFTGKRFYPVPYESGRILFYLAFSCALYVIQKYLLTHVSLINVYADTLLTAGVLITLFLLVVARLEKIQPVHLLRTLSSKIRRR